jgi:small subunit ribosomal protein S6
MPRYESIFIVRPSVPDEETTRIIDKAKGLLDRSGATILKLENWGKKKLAYEVKRERKGTYVYLHFQSGGEVINELERTYRLEDSVIKFITVRQEVEPVVKHAVGAKEPEGDRVQ